MIVALRVLLRDLLLLWFVLAGFLVMLGLHDLAGKLMRGAIWLVVAGLALCALELALQRANAWSADLSALGGWTLGFVALGHAVLGVVLWRRARGGRGTEADRGRTRERVRLPPRTGDQGGQQ